MNKINFHNHNFQYIIDDGVVYFILSDIATFLQYTNINVAVKHLKNTNFTERKRLPTKGGLQSVYIVNETGLQILFSINRTLTAEIKYDFLTYLTSLGLIIKKIVFPNKQETEFFDIFQQILQGMNILCIRQFNVLNFFVDLYIPSKNIVIEYDEVESHKSRLTQDKERQDKICNILQCKFLRVDNSKSHLWNCGLLIKDILS